MPMTTSTYWFDFKSFFIIRMMIYLCLIGAIVTFIKSGWFYSFIFNSVCDCSISRNTMQMIFYPFSLYFFVFIALMIQFFEFFVFGLFLIFSYSLIYTFFTLIRMIIRGTVGFVKFLQWLILFASGTLFGYDFIRHSFLHDRKLCLEPVTGYASVVGSFIIQRLKG